MRTLAQFSSNYTCTHSLTLPCLASLVYLSLSQFRCLEPILRKLYQYDFYLTLTFTCSHRLTHTHSRVLPQHALSLSFTHCVCVYQTQTHAHLVELSLHSTETHPHTLYFTHSHPIAQTHTHAHLVDETFPLYFSFSWLRRHLQFRLGISDGKKLCCVELGLEREKQTFLVFLLFCVTFLIRLLPLFFLSSPFPLFRLFCHLQLFLSFRQKTKQIRFRLIQIFNRKK